MDDKNNSLFEAIEFLKMLNNANDIVNSDNQKKKPKKSSELQAQAIAVAETTKELYKAFKSAGFSEDFTEKLIIAIISKEN